MITTICMLARDQDLRITRIPTVANGNVNTVEIDVKTDQMWEGFSLSAVFFNSEKGPVYEILLTNGKCTVPHEVLEKKTTLHIGLRGTAPDQKKVSTLVTYDIKKGAPESNATAEGPTPDVYQQILKRLDEINFGVSDERIEKVVRKYLENNPVNVVVDDALLEESENPVQNKVITKEIRELSEQIINKPIVMADVNTGENLLLYVEDGELMACPIKSGSGRSIVLRDVANNGLYSVYVDSENVYIRTATEEDGEPSDYIKITDKLTWLTYSLFIENGEMKIREV